MGEKRKEGGQSTKQGPAFLPAGIPACGEPSDCSHQAVAKAGTSHSAYLPIKAHLYFCTKYGNEIRNLTF